jgi:hypothetical protein
MKWLYRIGYLLIIAGIGREGYLLWQAHRDEALRREYLPRLEQELIRGYAADYGQMFCVAAPDFPVGDGLPETGWVRLSNGLSECRVIGERRLHGGLRNGCAVCQPLLELGLIEPAEITFQDAGGHTVTRPVYQLSETGRPLFFSEMSTRRAPVDRQCRPGEVRYAAADDGKPPVPGMGETGSGFCFADGLRLHAIRKYQTPVRFGREIQMGVEYDVEVVNPAPSLFEPGMRQLLHEIPARGSPALLPPVIGTATFKADSDEPSVFHNEVAIEEGRWISK